MAEPSISINTQKSAVRWPKNTHVIAAVSQDRDTAGSIFLSGIAERLESSKAVSIIEAYRNGEDRAAIEISREEDAKLKGLFPPNLEGPTKNIDKNSMWSLINRTAHREILLVTGIYNSEQKRDSTESKTIEQVFRIAKQFQIPENEIHILRQPTFSQLVDKFQVLKKRATERPNSEVLVVVDAHGTSEIDYGLEMRELFKALKPGGSLDNYRRRTSEEGAMIGKIRLRDGGFGAVKNDLNEFRLKGLFEEHLAGFKSVLILMVACRAGAWIR